MPKRKLIEYIKHPHYLEELTVEQLKEWIDEFPYSQNLRLLLAQKVSKSKKKSKKYAHIIQDAAVYSPDRAHMHHVLLSTKEVEKAKAEESKNAEIKETIAPVVTKDSDTAPIEETVVDETPIAVDPITEDELKMAVPAVGLALNAVTSESSQVQEEPVEEIATEAVEESAEPMAEAASDTDIGLSDYSQWLLSIDGRSAEDEEMDDDSEDDDEVVSEPLAKLLVTQGHIDKAVEMYRKLSLEYPEKSSYFAAQIEKIQTS